MRKLIIIAFVLFNCTSIYSKCANIFFIDLPDSLTTESEYILAAKNYAQLKNYKSAINITKIGLSKFDTSGALYNELGEVSYLENLKKEAIDSWEKGIKLSPNFADNYFNAARYYQINSNNILAALYAEIFINLSESNNTIEARLILSDAYKKIIAKDLKKQSGSFVNSVNDYLQQNLSQNNTATTNDLTLARTKFLLSWFYKKNDEKFPFLLFSYQNKLLSEGLFEAYNQWLFNVVLNPIDYKKWYDTNKKTYGLLQDYLNKNKLHF